MKIAIPYSVDYNAVFQHFGHAEAFKLFTVEDGKVVSSEVITPGVSGHSAIAAFLKGIGVDTVICGGVGDGAEQALSDAGIQLCSGIKGSADKAVASYLAGEIQPAGANCEKHESAEAGGDASDAEGGCGGCGSGCGGCGGGCGGCGTPAFEGPNVGKTVRVHYRGTFPDGTQFDSSYDRGEPLEFVCGAGQMILGFDKAVAGMKAGEEIDVHLMPEEAYGPSDPRAIFTLPITQLQGAEELSVGERVFLYGQDGRPFPVTVTAKDAVTITFDANHEMAGKELDFHIELVEVK